MKRYIMFPVSLLALTMLACGESPTDIGDPLFNNGGGNPKYNVKQTSCTLDGSTVTCTFKATGLGNGNILYGSVDVEGTVALWCENSQGKVPGGWAGRLRVGTGSGYYGPSSKNGQLTGTVGPFNVQYQGGAPFGCPPGLTLNNLISDLTWELNGTANGKALNTVSGSF